MINNILRRCLVVVVCQTLAYAPLLRADQLSLPSGDLVAPKISQQKYIDNVKEGTDHEVTVTVTDNVGVKQVTLYYRNIGTEEYKRQTMYNVVDTDDYTATVNSEEITPPGIEYYVQAMDNAGNTLLHGYSFSPLSVKTTEGDATYVASEDSAAIASEEGSSNTWLWIGLGVLAVGVAAAAGGGGGGGGGGTPTTATLNINASDPSQ